MKRPRHRKELNTEINITNLVDVVFCILILFMLTAPLMTKGIRVDLPKTNAPSMEDKKNLTVSMDSVGGLFVSGQPIAWENLGSEIKGQWDNQSPIFIQADENVPYGRVAQLMAELRREGVQKIGFMTQNGPAQSIVR